MKCYMPATGIVKIIDTLQYIPKEFTFQITTTEDYLQQEIGYIIAIMKYPLKRLTFLYYGNEKKHNQAYLPHFEKKHISAPLEKFHYPQCYNRVRMKIFNTKILSAHQHQIRGWNRFRNL